MRAQVDRIVSIRPLWHPPSTKPLIWETGNHPTLCDVGRAWKTGDWMLTGFPKERFSAFENHNARIEDHTRYLWDQAMKLQFESISNFLKVEIPGRPVWMPRMWPSPSVTTEEGMGGRPPNTLANNPSTVER